MRKTLPLLAVLALTGVLASGCAHSGKKLGRGLSNTFEIVRAGEFRRSVEQTSLFDGPAAGYSEGFVRGIGRTLGRTGLGVYEVVTFPFPTPGHGYDPICTGTFTPGPAFPDNYTPTLAEDSLFATDTNLGYSGGDVAPMIPGSRFRIFDTH